MKVERKVKVNIAVFASGRGSNFCAIARAAKKGELAGARISLLVCDNPRALVIRRAKAFKIKTLLACREDFSDRASFEQAIIQRLKAERVGLVVLAGFMRMLSAKFVKSFPSRILNIHPSLLPAFKGSTAIRDAFIAGVGNTGVTVHFVDALMDHGPIILQESLKIGRRDTLPVVERKIHAIEHKLYPEAIRLFAAGKLNVRGRRVTALTR
jgi:phosphoribosylglycinamide formyltransferase-1